MAEQIEENKTEQFQAVYACVRFSGFSFRVGTTTHRFEKHQLLIDDEEVAGEIDAFLKKYKSIGDKVKKVNLAAAEALVANHVATHGGAKSGPFSSLSSGQHEPNKIAERDAALSNMSVEDKQNLANKLASDSDLVMTEKTDVISAAPAPEPSLVENKPAVSPLAQKLKLN